MFLIIDIAINRSKGVKREGGRTTTYYWKQ